MIKTSAKHPTKASKSGADIITLGNRPTNFHGSHVSQTISPAKTSAKASNPTSWGKQSGKKNIHTTGGC